MDVGGRCTPHPSFGKWEKVVGRHGQVCSLPGLATLAEQRHARDRQTWEPRKTASTRRYDGEGMVRRLSSPLLGFVVGSSSKLSYCGQGTECTSAGRLLSAQLPERVLQALPCKNKALDRV